jgi:hypothetical protein
VAGECTEGPSSPFLGIPCDAAPSTANGRRRSGRYPGLPAYDLPIWKALVVGAIPAVAVRMIAVTFSLDPGPASQYARCIALERWDDTAGRWRLIRDPAESNVSLRGRLAWPCLAVHTLPSLPLPNPCGRAAALQQLSLTFFPLDLLSLSPLPSTLLPLLILYSVVVHVTTHHAWHPGSCSKLNSLRAERLRH